MVKEKYLPLEEPTPVPEPELTPAEKRKAKWDNFWFYYKKPFWIILFSIIAIIYITDPFTPRIKPDYTISVISSKYWTDAHIDRFSNALKPYGEDLNGDGQVVVDTQYFYIPEKLDSYDPEQLEATFVTLMAGFQTCESMIYLCDKPNAEYYGIESGIFCRLDDYSIVPEDDKETTVKDIGYGWLKVNALGQHAYFENSKTEMYFSLRSLDGTALEHEEYYNQSRVMLERMMKNEPVRPQELVDLLANAEKAYAEEQTAKSSSK